MRTSNSVALVRMNGGKVIRISNFGSTAMMKQVFLTDLNNLLFSQSKLVLPSEQPVFATFPKTLSFVV